MAIETELPLEVLLPYDDTLLPDGSSQNSIRVYRLQDMAMNGPMASIESYVDADNKKTVATITEKSGHYINGLLSPGARPEKVPLAFSKDTMTAAGDLDVLRGIPMIQPPEATTDGDLRLSYPLQFPGARSGFSPQVSIGYSAQSMVGNIAQGWSLSVPQISVETRWGVPEYDGDLETETYLFNGEQLVPEAGGYLFDVQEKSSDPSDPGVIDNRLAPLNLVPMPHRTTRLRPRKSPRPKARSACRCSSHLRCRCLNQTRPSNRPPLPDVGRLRARNRRRPARCQPGFDLRQILDDAAG